MLPLCLRRFMKLRQHPAFPRYNPPDAGALSPKPFVRLRVPLPSPVFLNSRDALDSAMRVNRVLFNLPMSKSSEAW
jgi:hypothetical protein